MYIIIQVQYLHVQNSFRLSYFYADKIPISDSLRTCNNRPILLKGGLLTDKHMDACLNTLSKQFPDIPDPQTALLAQLPGSLKAAQEKSMFFHNFSGHWALSRLSSGIVFLFDSLLPKELDLKLKEQMLSLYGKCLVQRPYVQRQQGSKVCGCFAIAFYVSLLYIGKILRVCCLTRRRCEDTYSAALHRKAFYLSLYVP